jgi:general secretion pathway protein D
MKVVLEISNESGTANIGGITQPIISQRKIEHEIRLKDGEMNLLGGILEQQELKSVSGTPVLGQIPILGRLFSQEKKEKIDNEIVFLLIPHVVRGQELSELNQRSFDVGTATGIGLRMNPKPVQKSENNPGEPSAPVANQPVQPTPAQGALAQPQATVPQASVQPQPSVQPTPLGGQSQPQATSQPTSPQQAIPGSTQASPQPATQQNAGAENKPASATPNGPLTLQLSPGSFTPSQGSTFAVNIVLSGGQDVFSVPVQISYDPQLLQFLTVSNGDFLAKDNSTVALVHRDDPATGTLIMHAQRSPGATGVSGDGTVFRLTFMAKNKGSGVIAITVPGARNSQNQPLQAMGSQASVTVSAVAAN